MLEKSCLSGLDFVPHVGDVGEHKQILFLFDEDYQIYLSRDVEDNFSLITCDDLEDFEIEDEISVGYLGEYICKAAIVSKPDDRFEAYNFREVLAFFNDSYPMLARAKTLLHWHHKSKFCSKCGAPTKISKTEICKVCSSCGELYFPVIAPATITIIRKGDKILLAHNSKFREGLYSIIAGFTETGESFEECAKREIMEEVGLKVKDLKYFGSQAWPFNNSQMVGFVAEYESGEITPDGDEITDADWFSIDNLPDLPSNLSISRKLMDFVIDEIQNNR